MAKKKKKVKEVKLQEVQSDIISEVGTMTINFKNWVINGTGSLCELQEVINQLKGLQ